MVTRRERQPTKIEKSKPEEAYSGFFKIEKYRVRHERYDGSMSEEQVLEVFERGDAVSVLLVDPDVDEVFLTEQFRLPTHLRGGTGWLIEPPAGMIRKGESPIECLKREVIEETGYQIVSEVTKIAQFFVSPGGSTEIIYLFHAEVRATDKKSAGGGVVKDGEDIYVMRMSVEEFLDKLDRRELEDAKLIIAAQWLKLRRARQPAEKGVEASKTINFRLKGTSKIIGYKTGSIEAVRDVDVWVNPTDTDMIMDRFGAPTVSAVIRRCGAEKYPGPEARIREDTVANDLRATVKRPFVKPTEVVDTVSGALERTHNVKRIFHVAVAAGAIGERLVTKEETLEVCVEKVLEHIDAKNRRGIFESVLFPILGTGKDGFFNRNVVPRLVRRAMQYFVENPYTRLSKIYFCAYTHSDKDILDREFAKAVAAGELEVI